MMAPRDQQVLRQTDVLAPAEQDIKNIANKMGKKMMRRQRYEDDGVDYTQHPNKRMWKGRLGRRGPLRQRQEDEEQAQMQGQDVSLVSSDWVSWQ
jgi:hypothetical protein